MNSLTRYKLISFLNLLQSLTETKDDLNNNQIELGDFLRFIILPFRNFSIYLCFHTCMKSRIWFIAEVRQSFEEYKIRSHQEGLSKVVQQSWCSFLENAMAYELSCPTEQLSRQNNLPCEREFKVLCKKTSRDPTSQTENSSQRTTFPIQTHIEHSIYQSEQKPKIGNQTESALKWAIKEARCEVEEYKGSEEDWPHKQHVNQDIHWVFVISPVEGEVLLEVKQSGLTH